MILLEDKGKKYNDRLTNWFKEKEDLIFATKHFKNDKKTHCIIKKENERVAVFVEGEEPTKED
jgi:hypothetical protein